MKCLVFGGAGKMGTAVAFDLLRASDVTTVGLADRRLDALQAVQARLKDPRITLHEVDVTKKDDVMALMKRYDVGVNTLPTRRTSYLVVDAAVRAGLHIADLLEEYHRRPDAYEVEGLELPAGMSAEAYGDWLHETAVKNGVCFLDGIGFAPGLSNVTCGEGIRKLDVAESAIARVGGIPRKDIAERNPLRYMITWAFGHVLREYMIRVNIIEDGRIVEVDASSRRETFLFDRLGQRETLECAVTPGMPSFIFTRPDLREFAEKTVRWPGHWDGIATLKECGMLDIDPIQVGNCRVSPREVLLASIEPRLRARDGDTDVCVMYNTVVGRKNGRRTRVSYHLWDEADTTNGISSMGRVTGYSAAIGAVMIGRGVITERGCVPPEDAIYGERYTYFMKELDQRHIRVDETVETID